jgi:hypothetical protein
MHTVVFIVNGTRLFTLKNPRGMTVEFDENDYLAFRKRYRQAVKNKEESFKFKGNEYLTTFAKYVLEYLEMNPIIQAVMNEPDPGD